MFLKGDRSLNYELKARAKASDDLVDREFRVFLCDEAPFVRIFALAAGKDVFRANSVKSLRQSVVVDYFERGELVY